MPRASARQVAQHALRRWREGHEFADFIAHTALSESGLAGIDRAFALELFYGCLRNLTLLDFWIARLRPTTLEPLLRDVVQLGLFQLLLLETSEHAAVFETVNLVEKRQRGVVNGILRAAARERSDMLACGAEQPLHVRTSHPEFLVKRWRSKLGDTIAEKLCAWNNQPPPLFVRINKLRVAATGFTISGAEPFAARPTFLRVNGLPRGEMERGEVYVQDPSTALAPELLDARPGDAILDACAAPGGKTALVAELTENQSEIVACDRDDGRLDVLRANLRRLGAHALTVQQDWTSPIRSTALRERMFDRILLDAPCSNTGVMRRRVDVRWRLTPDDFLRMPDLQLQIVRNVTPLLKPGGTLVYSTCSLEHEENEANIERILGALPSLRIAATDMVTPWKDGIDGAFAARFESAA